FQTEIALTVRMTDGFCRRWTQWTGWTQWTEWTTWTGWTMDNSRGRSRDCAHEVHHVHRVHHVHCVHDVHRVLHIFAGAAGISEHSLSLWFTEHVAQAVRRHHKEDTLGRTSMRVNFNITSFRCLSFDLGEGSFNVIDFEVTAFLPGIATIFGETDLHL